ncbi:MAG: hypothetical protein RSE58_07055 [Clostridia bacterium]
MEKAQKQTDEYLFVRERAAWLYAQGEYEQARKLLKPMDDEQLKRFEAYGKQRTEAAK